MKRGKFIVIEGGDGAGKDTQIELLQKDFSGENFVYTRDPGGTPLGTELRKITQYGDNIAKETEMLLFLASRAQLVYEVINPALSAGKHVISNRFDLSTMAYQIYGRERMTMKEFVRQASLFARGNLVPDLIVLLDVLPEVGLHRLTKRQEKATRFEQEALEFHRRVRQGYLESAKEYPSVVIVDGSRSIEEVKKDVREAIVKTLPQGSTLASYVAS